MVDYQKLVNDVLKLGGEIGLKITELTWPRKLNLPVFDIEIKFEKFGKYASGRGMSIESFDDALTRAIGECLERIGWSASNAKTTNGFAFHTDLSRAKDSAFFELIERDSFLCHYLTKTSPPKLAIIKNQKLKTIMRFLNSQKVSLNLYKSTSIEGLPTVICVLTGIKCWKKFGYFIGSSCDREVQTAQIKAILEALRSLISFLYSKPTPLLTLSGFNSKFTWEPSDHENLYINTEGHAFELFESWPIFSPSPQTRLNVSFNSLSLPSPFNDIGYMHIAECSSEALQPLYFGPTTPDVISINRLNKFLGHPVNFSDLNIFPHPYC